MLFYIGQFLISALCHGLGYVSLGISYFYKWPSFQNTGRKAHHLAGVYGSSFPIILALQDMAVEGVCSLYIHRVFLRVCTAPSDNAGRCTNRVPQYAFSVFRTFRLCFSWCLNGKIFAASITNFSTSVPGSTMISISVDSLSGCSVSRRRLVPPLKTKSMPTCASASSSPKAYMTLSSSPGSFLYFFCNPAFKRDIYAGVHQRVTEKV